MGLIGIVRSTVRLLSGSRNAVEVKGDFGGGRIRNAVKYSTPGDDSLPLADDMVVAISHESNGGQVALGYIDTKNQSQSNPGERRSYARDSGGAVVSVVYQKNDGTVDITNLAGGVITMVPSGSVFINGLEIDLDGNLITSGTVTGETDVVAGPDSVSGATHTHDGVEPGGGTTGPPT